MKTPKPARGECPLSRRTLLRGGLLAGVTTLADASAVVEIAAVLDTAIGVAPAEAQQSRSGGGPQPQTSLAQAIRVAERQTGGRARKAEMDREKGTYVYEIKTVSKDGSSKVHVDPASRSILRVQEPGFVSNIFDRDDRRKDQAAFVQLEASPMTLASAVEAAEKETRGRAVKALVKSQYGSTLFEVAMVKDLITHSVLVDPATAKVVTLPPYGKRKDDDD